MAWQQGGHGCGCAQQGGCFKRVSNMFQTRPCTRWVAGYGHKGIGVDGGVMLHFGHQTYLHMTEQLLQPLFAYSCTVAVLL